MYVSKVSQSRHLARQASATIDGVKFRGPQALSAKVEVARRRRIFLRTGKQLLIAAICVSSCAMTGCVESSFTLASESSLPRFIALPPGLTRKDVSVRLNLYAPLRGPDAKFELRNRKGKKLAEVKGNVKHSYLSPYNEIVVVNGITEVVALKPYRAHENMERNGIPDALFYVIVDSCARREVLEGGLPTCPKNEMNQNGMNQNAASCPCLTDPK